MNVGSKKFAEPVVFDSVEVDVDVLAVVVVVANAKRSPPNFNKHH